MLDALFLNCTLKPSPEPSNTEGLARVLIAEMDKAGLQTELVRLVDLDVKPGVKSDQGPGDAWPGVRAKILKADILVMCTPTWLGQPSSLCQRALERMDAMIGETTPDGLPVAYGKTAGIVVTGNEDGAHHIVGVVAQSLIDVGFTVPGWSWTYWHLGPGAGPSYLDTPTGHDYADRVGRNAARNLIAAAEALKGARWAKPESGG
jgi:multimeric flavodoxin WrbA